MKIKFLLVFLIIISLCIEYIFSKLLLTGMERQREENGKSWKTVFASIVVSFITIFMFFLVFTFLLGLGFSGSESTFASIVLVILAGAMPFVRRETE